jgi:hypothetical protein
VDFLKEAAQRAALSALEAGIKSGGVAFLEEIFRSLGDKQLEAVIRVAKSTLESRKKTVTSP